MKNEWQNFGDVSPWHGQLWVKYGDSDYAECVEIIGPSDLESLADNQVMIVFGSIYVSPQWEDWQSALECVGFDFNGPPDYFELIRAFHAYRGQDPDPYASRSIVQIGTKAETWCMPDYAESEKATIVLHGNTKLENYVKGLML